MDDPPLNEKGGAGVELPPNGAVDTPEIWPANRLDPILGVGVFDPEAKLNDGMLSEAFGVAAKVTDGLAAAGAADPNVKAGALGGSAGSRSCIEAIGAPKVNTGVAGEGATGPPNEMPPVVAAGPPNETPTEGGFASSSLSVFRRFF